MRWWLAWVGLIGGWCAADDGHVGGVTGLAVDGGEVVWSVSQGGVFRGVGESSEAVVRPGFRVMDVAVAGEGVLLVGGGVAGERGVVAMVKDGVVGEEERVGEDLVYAVAVSGDGRWSAVACADGRVLVRDGDGEWEVVHRHTGTGTAVCFSGDGRLLASGGLDGVVMVSAVGNGKAPVVIDDHTAGVCCVAFAPDGQTLASGSRDSKVRLHAVADGRLVRTYSGLGMEDEPVAGRVVSRVLSTAWGGDRLLAGTSKGWVYRLSLEDDGWERSGGEAGFPVRALAVDGGRVLAGGREVIVLLESH